MKSKLIVLSAALMLVLAGCGSKEASFTPASSGSGDASSQTQDVAVESVSLNRSTLSLAVGEHETLVATVLPSDATDKTVTWESSSAHVTVDDGLVTAISEGTAVVTARAGDKSASCTVTVTAEAVEETLNFGEEANKPADTWVYWNDHPEWCGSDVQVTTAKKKGKTVTFEYSVVSGSCDWGFQVFYKNSALAEGASYAFTAKINSQKAVSAASGYFTINGVALDLVAGDNNITVKYLEGGAAASSCKIVVSTAMGSNKLVISDYDWEGILDTPAAIAVTNDYHISFTKHDGAASYLVKYYNSAKAYLDNEAVADSGAQLAKPASLADGNYYLTVTAVSALDELHNSRESELVLFKVGGGSVTPAGGPKTDMQFGEEANLPLDLFVYWNDHTAWCGSDVQINDAYTEEGLVHVEYTVASGSCDWGLQLFYKNSSLSNSTAYTLTFKMKVAANGTYNLGPDSKAQALTAGTWTEVTYDYTEAGDKASLKVVVATSISAHNTIEMKDFAWVAK